MKTENVASILNDFPRDKFNVLIPVTTMQAMSSLQKVIINQVQLDTSVDDKGSGRDIYKERNGRFAITKVGGMKLASAANVSIVSTEKAIPEGCIRCIDMSKATGKVQPCGNCDARYNVGYRVTIRVPDPTGGFRLISATKEIDCQLEKDRMKTLAQYTEFLPHRSAICESKAFMRALRSALGLSATYTLQELRKPFVVAHVVPNLDNPAIQSLAAQSMLQSMGLLFEAQNEAPLALTDGTTERREINEPDEPDEPMPDYLMEPEPEPEPDPDLDICEGCHSPITDTANYTADKIVEYSMRYFNRKLCMSCQREARKEGARK